MNNYSILDNKDLVDRAFTVYPHRHIRNYNMSNLYNDLQVRCNIRYFEVPIGSDTVIAFYKDVQMYSHRAFRLLGFPISLSKNKSNELRVYNALVKQVPLINEIEISNLEVLNYDLGSVGEPTDYDFYYTIDNLIDNTSKGSWRRKHHINKFKDDITIRKATSLDYNDVYNLHIEWMDYKDKKYKSSGMFKKYFKNFDKYVDNTYLLFYQNTLIAFSVFDDIGSGITSKIMENSYNIHFYPDHLSSCRQLFSRISYIHLYYQIRFLKDLGFTGFNVGGARDKSLLESKRRYCDREIHYYKIKLKE